MESSSGGGYCSFLALSRLSPLNGINIKTRDINGKSHTSYRRAKSITAGCLQ